MPDSAARPSAPTENEARRFAHQAIRRPDRARQFMPFAALKGFDELIREQEILAAARYENQEGSSSAPLHPDANEQKRPR